MSLAAYTPFQQSILAVVRNTQATCEYLRKDMQAFADVHLRSYSLPHPHALGTSDKIDPMLFDFQRWQKETADELGKGLKELTSRAMKFASFPEATPEQEQETLRHLSVTGPLPASIRSLIHGYLFEELPRLGDITKIMFDSIVEYKVFDETWEEFNRKQGTTSSFGQRSYGDFFYYAPRPQRTSQDIIRGIPHLALEKQKIWDAFRSAAQTHTTKIMTGTIRLIFPVHDEETQAIESLKLKMLIANLKVHNRSARGSSVTIEEVT